VRCVYLNNPALTRDEFVRMLANRFSLSAEAAVSKAALLSELERVLLERRTHGEITALVVDEAQSLSVELLEEIRLLANIETNDQRLLPLVLAGQPELSLRLEESSLRQLKQRVALRCEIAPFQLAETAAYIACRIRTAGGVPSKLFTREGVSLIHEHSGGIPRTVSVICDNALVSGLALEKQPVDRAIVMEVCRDFMLRRKESGDGWEVEGRYAPAEQTSLDSAPTAADTPDAEEPGDTLGQLSKPKQRFSLFGSRQR
jgi:general secretion pathway protein A